MAKLTALAVEKAKPGAARREVPDGLLGGLYLIIQPSGAKSWAVRYRYRGTQRKLTLGAYPAIDLASARDLGAKALRRVAEGNDPAGEKRASRAASSDIIEHIVAEYVRRDVKQKRSGRKIERALQRFVVAEWKGRRIQDIRKRDVIDLTDRIAERAPVMANRAFETIRTFFNWCRSKDIISVSPCDGVKAPTKETARDRVLTDHELQAVWRAADVVKWPYGPMIKLLILTGCRRTEISDLRWSEVDIDGRAIKLPRERVKNDRAHDVPLSNAAVAILQRIPRSRSGFVFPSENSGTSVSYFSGAKRRFDAAILAATGERLPHWTFHDIRRTVASGMARLGINLPVIEKVLNHTSGSFSGVLGIYQRHEFADERRRAIDVWAAFVEGLVSGAPVGNVVALRG